MADHPLRPATHPRLGEPLPHQLANRPRAHPQVIAFRKRPPFTAPCVQGVVLFGISLAFARLSPAQRQITHVLLTRAPRYLQAEARFPFRLACVMHAASVCSEPGSNSPIENSDPLIFQGCSARKSLHPQISKHAYLVFKEQPSQREELHPTNVCWGMSSLFFEGLFFPLPVAGKEQSNRPLI